ncbi:MAG: hypothetical protein HY738_12010 [Bacteroidia bacterium]|nr:hypothetical protein [Bacteroidia bacterium]
MYSSSLFSQYTNENKEIEKKYRGGMIKTNPLAMLCGPIIFTSEFRVVYETPIAPQQAFQIGVSYLGKSPLLGFIERADSLSQQGALRFTVNGFRVQLAYKLYFMEVKAKYRFYIAPFVSGSLVRISRRSLSNINYYLRAKYINYNIIIGYQTPLFTDRLDFDLFTGLGYRDIEWHEIYGTTVTKIDEKDFIFY